MCFCGNGVGRNISMKGYGYNGGEKLVGERGKICQQKTSTRNCKFTMIGLASFDGEPAMCVLILEGGGLLMVQ